MMTKFNQGMYAKMKAKKNKPFLNLRKRVVRVMEKGVSVTPSTPVTESTRTTSPATSMEEITPLSKMQPVADKGKEKATSHLSSVWDDSDFALTRAQDAFTVEELKVFSSVPSNEIVDRHVLKLVQVVYLCKDSPFLFLCSESWTLFSSIGGDHPYHLGVPKQRGEGHVSEVPNGGFGG